MRTKKCLDRFEEHSWSVWHAYEQMTYESMPLPQYKYYRECSLYGCFAKEDTEDLAPVGTTRLRENP